MFAFDPLRTLTSRSYLMAKMSVRGRKVSVILLICSAVIEFTIIWWVITHEYRKPANLRRFVAGLALTVCVFFSPWFQIAMIRQAVAEKELATALAYGWVIVTGICWLILMFTLFPVSTYGPDLRL